MNSNYDIFEQSHIIQLSSIIQQLFMKAMKYFGYVQRDKTIVAETHHGGNATWLQLVTVLGLFSGR